MLFDCNPMDFEDDNEDIFGELFGSQTKKAARIISPNRPQQSATKIQEESSNQSDSDDDDFALPSAKTPSAPATGKGASPAEAKNLTVDGGSGSSGMQTNDRAREGDINIDVSQSSRMRDSVRKPAFSFSERF